MKIYATRNVRTELQSTVLCVYAHGADANFRHGLCTILRICVVGKWRRSNEKNEKATSLVIISYSEAVIPSEVRSLLGVPLTL